MGTFMETSLNYVPQNDINKSRTPITFNLFKIGSVYNHTP
jgi:hypothetical protein